MDPVPSVRRAAGTVPAGRRPRDRAALAKARPPTGFPSARRVRRLRSRRRPTYAGRRGVRVGRRAPLPQPQRRPGERVLRRRHHRGRHRAPLEDPRAEGDLARLGDAVQEARAEPARDRRHARRATLLDGSVRRAGDRVRIVAQLDRRRVGSASLGRDVRPPSSTTSSRSRPTSRCTSPPRSRPSSRRRADRASAGADDQPRGVPALPAGAALATLGTPRTLSRRPSSTSSRPSTRSDFALAHAELAIACGGAAERQS